MRLSFPKITWFKRRWIAAGVCLFGLAAPAADTSRHAAGAEGFSGVAGAVGESMYEGTWPGQKAPSMGALFRLGHTTGPFIGREESLTPVELMPYAFYGNTMLFGDLRGFRSNHGDYGANVGAGVRHYIEPWDRIIGLNGYHDYDETSGALFRDVGFGVETLGRYWDARANAYFPVGNDESLLEQGVVAGSQRFQGNNILFDRFRSIGTALRGVDAEIGVPVFLTPFMERHDVRVFGGFYHYADQQETIESLYGWKGKLQGNVIPSVQLVLEVAHDRVFDTNVSFGVQWTWGGFRQGDDERKTQFNRMTTPVSRNYNVVVARTRVIDEDEVAINPATGNPYFVEHVAAPNINPDGPFVGTVENPFQFIQDAQTQPGGDIIYVHADSVFDTAPNNSVNLEPGVRVLGEGTGVNHTIQIAGIGNVLLPRATDGINRPELQNSAAENAVTLDANAEFSGFVLRNPFGRGISNVVGGVAEVDNFGNTVVRSVDVINAAQQGILINDATGTITFARTTLNDTGTPSPFAAFEVNGGTAAILFSGNPDSQLPDINNVGGEAVLVNGVEAGGSVNLTGSEIQDVGGGGIQLIGGAGDYTIDEALIVNSVADGVNVSQTAGRVTFRGPLTVTAAALDGINIESTAASGLVTFTDLSTTALGINIGGRLGAGVDIRDNEGIVRFFTPLNIAGLGNATAAGVDIQQNSSEITFAGVTVSGGNSDGVRIGPSDLGANAASATINFNGPLRVLGPVTGNGLLINGDAATVSVGLTNSTSVFSGFADSGIRVIDNTGDVTFNGTVQVDKSGNVVAPAVDIQNNAVDPNTAAVTDVSFETLQILGATLADDLVGAGLNVVNNEGVVGVDELQVSSFNGVGVLARDTTAIQIGNGFVDSQAVGGVGRAAIDIENSGMSVTLRAVTSDQSNGFGVLLLNNTGIVANTLGSFIVTGTDPTRGGGVISGAAADGVFAVNSGDIALRNMTFTDNVFDGVHVENMRALEVSNSTITSNLESGVRAFNTDNVVIQGSTISLNGGALDFPEIRLEADQAPSFTPVNQPVQYTWTVARNTISETGSDALRVRSLATNVGPLVLTVGGPNNVDSQVPQRGGPAFSDGNAFVVTSDFDTDDAVDVIWNNQLTMLAQWNTVNFGGTPTLVERSAFRVTNASTTSPSIVTIVDNQVTSSRTGTTGIDLTLQGPSTVTASRNTFLFNGSQTTLGVNTGLRFVLGPNTFTTVENNVITDNVDGGRGIIFESVSEAGTFVINNNNILLQNPFNGGFLEQGIVFETVTGTVNLQGTVNNVVTLLNNNSGGTFFGFQSGLANGTIIVNGSSVP